METRATFNSVSVEPTANDTLQMVVRGFGPAFAESLTSVLTIEKRLGEPEDLAFIV